MGLPRCGGFCERGGRRGLRRRRSAHGGTTEPSAVSPTLRATDLLVMQNDVPPDTRKRHDTVAEAFKERYGGDSNTLLICLPLLITRTRSLP